MYKYVPIIYMLMPMYSSGLVLNGKNCAFLYVMSLILHFNTTYTES